MFREILKQWRYVMRHLLWLTLFVLASANATQAEVISDSFDDGSLAPLWDVELHGASVVESGGKLNIDASGYGAWGAVTSRFASIGDFDVSVYFEDFSVGIPQDQFASLLLFGTGTNEVVMGIYVSPTSLLYEYLFADGFSGDSAATTDTNGAFRIVREGSTISGYYRDAASWTRLGTSNMGWTGPATVMLAGGYDYPESRDLSVSFDNFHAEDQIVPEPSTFVLLCTCGVCLLLYAFRWVRLPACPAVQNGKLRGNAARQAGSENVF